MVRRLKQNISTSTQAPMTPAQIEATAQNLEKQAHDHPDDFQVLVNLASIYEQLQRFDQENKTLDSVVANPKADAQAVMFAAQAYARHTNQNGLEKALERMTTLEPGSPEAWYDLAAIKAMLGKAPEAMTCLRSAMEKNSQRLAVNPKAKNLATMARTDPRFGALRQTPQFKKIVKQPE